MDIIVRKPTDGEIAGMKSKPVWTCDVSEFVWQVKKPVKKHYIFE